MWFACPIITDDLLFPSFFFLFFLESILGIDLEGLDNQFHDRANRERDEILKQALILQVELERTRREMVRLGMRLNDDGGDGDDDDVPSRDFGSFDHHVDYRSMAEYESH